LDLGGQSTAGGTTTIASGGKLNAQQTSILSGTINDAGTVSGGTVAPGANLNILSGGQGSNTIVAAGGTETVFAGGSATNTTVSGSLIVNSGTTVSNTTVASGGNEYVSSGAVVSGTKLLAGGQEVISSGGKAFGTVASGSGAHIWTDPGAITSGAVLSDGGTQGVGAGTASGTIVNSGGVLSVLSNTEAGSAVAAVVNSGGQLSAFQNGVVSGGTVNAAGSASIKDGGKLIGTLVLSNGGFATIDANAGGTILMDGSTNHGLVVSGLANGGTLSTTIASFDGASAGTSDGIEIDGLNPDNVTNVAYNGDNQVILTLSNKQKITLNINGIKQSGYSLQKSADGDVLFEVCFLAGSMIRTGSGAAAVESLQIGDSVMTWDWKAQAAVERQIVWTGRKHMTVKADRADDEAGYPVRILKNAIAENVPSQDLLVTPEHCLFFDNRFVPVRMLVNGQSIVYDHSITSYDYFHIETEEHAVIWANDTLTESYLDTGNRGTFAQDGSVVRLTPKAPEKTWEADGAASLSVERGFVEPLFNTLVQRAASEGFASQTKALELTHQSDIHLVTKQGQTIRPVRQMKDQVVFMVPAGVDAVQIASRTSRPSDTIGPFVDDRRHLGVLVGQVVLFDGKTNHAITTHLEQAGLAGWDVQEAVPCRWTNGNALLPLPVVPDTGLRMLTLQVIAAGPYGVQKTAKTVASLKTAG
ncbi:Hint domain-containing protein, partial [Acetobacter sp.]|uniref:Hint domain-containing protein n=1 Tax=Acetobacter sp. TaxID=440 RepID=UPI0039E7B68A